MRTSALRGADPLMGPRLDVMLTASDFVAVSGTFSQPSGRTGGVKHIPEFMLAAMREDLIAAGPTTRTEIDELFAALSAFAPAAGHAGLHAAHLSPAMSAP